MRGAAGEFINVSWPGYAGTLTASAPGRFAAAINQAPLRRRTRKPWLRPYDLAANALRMGSRSPAMALTPMKSQSQAGPSTRLSTSTRTLKATKRRNEMRDRARTHAPWLTGCGHMSQV